MSASRRTLVLQAITERLQTIVAGRAALMGEHFETDAGRAVFWGEVPQLGDGDPDQAIAVMPRSDEPRLIGRTAFQIEWPINIHAVVKVSLDDPWTAAEQVIADIKRAIETTDQGFEGLVQDLTRDGVSVQAREAGSLVVSVTVPYRFVFREAWGRP